MLCERVVCVVCAVSGVSGVSCEFSVESVCDMCAECDVFVAYAITLNALITLITSFRQLVSVRSFE